MKIALIGNTLCIADLDNVQFQVVKSWNLTKYDRQTKCLKGPANLELLEKLASITNLPTGGGISPKTGKPYPNIAEYYRNLKKVQETVDKERFDESPVAILPPPVKSKLYTHQIRGYNMALLTFGWAEPEEEA